jgi:spore coat protein CotH
MKDADWKAMQADIAAKEYYRADIWIDGEQVKDVAVRTKGSSSLMSASTAKNFRAGLKVDFNFFNSARSYHGIKKVVYNNGFSDPTLMKEFLGYELMAEMGLPTPRACFVDLWVNDAHLGVYTEVEAVDGTFVSEHFGDANGNLYKPEITAGRLNWTEADAAAQAEAASAGASAVATTSTTESFNVGGGDLEDIIQRLGDNAGWIPGRLTTTTTTGGGLGGGNVGAGRFMSSNSNYLVSVGLKTNEDKADYSGLYRLLDVLNSKPSEVSTADLEKILDVDEVLRFLAVSVALVHLDNYIGMGHNYYLYQAGGKFSIIPWDLNMTFGGFDSGLSEDQLLDFYIDEPTSASVDQYPLVEQLIDEPEYLATYHSYLKQLIEGPFSVEHMTARINQIADLIRPYVEKDDNMLFTVEDFERGLTEDLAPSSTTSQRNMGGRFIGLTYFVTERTASIAAQLGGAQAASKGDGSGNGGSVGLGGIGGAGQGGLPGGQQRPQGNAPGGGQRPAAPTTTTTTVAPDGGAAPGGG